MESTFSLFYRDPIEPGKCVTSGEIERMQFPGGERHIRLRAGITEVMSAGWVIESNLYDSAGVMDLLLLTDALRRSVVNPDQIDLVMPYVPYARQDRVAVDGEPLSIAVFCQLINAMNFRTVTVSDPHSDVTSAMLHRVQIRHADEFVRTLYDGALREMGIRNLAVVAPDAGARRRAERAAQALGMPLLQASKKRDPVSGRLSDAQIEDPLPNCPLLIVDDLCDGGGTFVKLADVLRAKTQQPLFLYVTHGLFTKGMAPLLAKFEGVFTAHCADPKYADLTSLHGKSIPAS